MTDFQRLVSFAHLPPPRPWVRFFARTVDWYLFGLVAFLMVLILPLGLSTTLPMLGVPNRLWPSFVMGFVLLAIILGVCFLVLAEPVCFALWGATPGKSLLRVSVKNPDGSRLGFRQALRRLLKVLYKGEGLYLPFVSILTHWRTYQQLQKNRITSWDQNEQLCVSHQPIGPVRVAVASGILVPGFILINGFSAVAHFLLENLQH